MMEDLNTHTEAFCDICGSGHRGVGHHNQTAELFAGLKVSLRSTESGGSREQELTHARGLKEEFNKLLKKRVTRIKRTFGKQMGKIRTRMYLLENENKELHQEARKLRLTIQRIADEQKRRIGKMVSRGTQVNTVLGNTSMVTQGTQVNMRVVFRPVDLGTRGGAKRRRFDLLGEPKRNRLFLVSPKGDSWSYDPVTIMEKQHLVSQPGSSKPDYENSKEQDNAGYWLDIEQIRKQYNTDDATSCQPKNKRVITPRDSINIFNKRFDQGQSNALLLSSSSMKTNAEEQSLLSRSSSLSQLLRDSAEGFQATQRNPPSGLPLGTMKSNSCCCQEGSECSIPPTQHTPLSRCSSVQVTDARAMDAPLRSPFSSFEFLRQRSNHRSSHSSCDSSPANLPSADRSQTLPLNSSLRHVLSSPRLLQDESSVLQHRKLPKTLDPFLQATQKCNPYIGSHTDYAYTGGERVGNQHNRLKPAAQHVNAYKAHYMSWGERQVSVDREMNEFVSSRAKRRMLYPSSTNLIEGSSRNDLKRLPDTKSRQCCTNNLLSLFSSEESILDEFNAEPHLSLVDN